MGEWVQLEKGNDWGSTFYALPGALKPGGTYGTRDGVKLYPGRRYAVRFPDGHVESCALRAKSVNGSVMDHGHMYQFTNQTVGALVEFHGLNLWVEVNEIELLRSEVEHERERPVVTLGDKIRSAIARECHVEATVEVDHARSECVVTYPNPSADRDLHERVYVVAYGYMSPACPLRVVMEVQL